MSLLQSMRRAGETQTRVHRSARQSKWFVYSEEFIIDANIALVKRIISTTISWGFQISEIIVKI